MKVGYEVQVIANNDAPEYDFLIGKIGYVEEVRSDGIVVGFAYDEAWADQYYIFDKNEITLTEEQERNLS